MIFASSPWLACYQRWINAAKKDEGNHQSHPDDKAEQAEQINRRQPADTFLPKLSKIAHHADREKRHNEKDTAKSIGFPHGRLELPGKLRRSAQRQDQNHHESHNVADDKLRKALPDLPNPGLLTYAHIDARRPDIGENERPNADEDIDENLNGRGGAKDPTFLEIHSSRRRARQDQRFCNAAAGDCGTVWFYRQPHPGTGYQRFVGQKGLRSEWQDQ